MARRTRYTKRMVSQRIVAGQSPVETTVEEEPMHRYTHTIPTTLPNRMPIGTIPMCYIEESLARQNQILLDILTAINTLTEALTQESDE